MDFTIDNNAKITAMKIALEGHEQSLYQLLVTLFIDPETFDADSWDVPLNKETPEGRVVYYLQTIETIKEKIAALEAE